MEVTVKIGDHVEGEIGEGEVIAMSSQWCIYKDKDEEIAEPWESIRLKFRLPEHPVSSVEFKTLHQQERLPW